MSSSEGEAAPAGPVKDPSDRWLGAKGPGRVEVAVRYKLQGNGVISSSWEVDGTKAIPSNLPMFMYRFAHHALLCSCMYGKLSPGEAVYAILCTSCVCICCLHVSFEYTCPLLRHVMLPPDCSM